MLLVIVMRLMLTCDRVFSVSYAVAVTLILFVFCSAHRWAINIRRQDLIKQTPSYLNKNCYLCSKHFEPQMFLNDLKNRLQPTAVPTVVQVPNPPKLLFSSSRKRTRQVEVSNCKEPLRKKITLEGKSPCL